MHLNLCAETRNLHKHQKTQFKASSHGSVGFIYDLKYSLLYTFVTLTYILTTKKKICGLVILLKSCSVFVSPYFKRFVNSGIQAV